MRCPEVSSRIPIRDYRSDPTKALRIASMVVTSPLIIDIAKRTRMMAIFIISIILSLFIIINYYLLKEK